ncbi:cupin [Cellulomonas fimi]|uniref:Cupin n=1 Tax=Cellulomonas fimi TaxID=1708 RepID=A0A7Y0QIT8_CELFI|nr:cupin [Cellulomonas fimi]NMR21588.1 cupin [Cellulomonas fimi]
MIDLPILTEAHLAAARASERGRSAELVLHDGELRQSVIALTAGTELAEHNAPPAASLQVLTGRVRVTDGAGGAEVADGSLYLLTHERHAVVALEDSVFLLTTVTSVPA